MGDTVGVGTPATIAAMFQAAADVVPLAALASCLSWLDLTTATAAGLACWADDEEASEAAAAFYGRVNGAARGGGKPSARSRSPSPPPPIA